MSLLKRIDDDMIQALKKRDSFKTTLLRGLKSDIKYKAIEKKDDLSDDEIIAVLSSAAKRRRESIEQFRNGHRQDLVDKETAELTIISQYLPEQMSPEELREIITGAIEKTGADSPSKLGLVMKEIMPRIKGKADGKMVNRIVLQLLADGDD